MLVVYVNIGFLLCVVFMYLHTYLQEFLYCDVGFQHIWIRGVTYDVANGSPKTLNYAMFYFFNFANRIESDIL